RPGDPRMFRWLAPWFVLVPPLTAAAADDPKDALWAAARKGDSQTVRQLLDAGVDVNAATPYGATALSFAADKGHVEVVKLLLSRKADVNAKDTFYGATPFTWAVSRDHATVVGLLLEAGATGGDAILISAARQGQVALVRAILEKGKPKPETLTSALGAAENREVIDLLTQASAKPSEKPQAT